MSIYWQLNINSYVKYLKIFFISLIFTLSCQRSVEDSSNFSAKEFSNDLDRISFGLKKIDLKTKEQEFYSGDSITIEAIGTYQDGTTENISAFVSLKFEEAILSIKNHSKESITLQANSSGEFTISASLRDLTAILLITIKPAKLLGIFTAPENLAVFSNLTTSIEVFGIYSDQSVRKIIAPNEIKITSEGKNIAFSWLEEKKIWLISPSEPGDAMIHVEYAGLMAKTPIKIKDGSPTSIVANPAEISILAGKSIEIKVMALNSEGLAYDITDLAKWSFEQNEIFRFIDEKKEIKQIDGLKPGRSSIQIEYNGLTIDIPITVGLHSIKEIATQIDSDHFLKDGIYQLKVMATFNDETRANIASFCQINSSAPEIATLSEDGSGIFKAKLVGEVQFEVDCFGLKDSLAININDPMIIDMYFKDLLNREIFSLNIPRGLSKTLKVIGISTDGQEFDISNMVEFQTSNPSIITVTKTSGLGVTLDIKAESVGESWIYFSLEDVKDRLFITADAPVLESIRIEPAVSSDPLGFTRQFELFGRYSHQASEIQLSSNSIVWSVIYNTELYNKPPAFISNNQGEKGLLKTLAEGEVSIKATIGNETATASYVILPPLLNNISITSPASITKGQNAVLSAQASYTDGTIKSLADLCETYNISIAVVETNPQSLIPLLINDQLCTSQTLTVDGLTEGVAGLKITASHKTSNQKIESVVHYIGVKTPCNETDSIKSYGTLSKQSNLYCWYLGNMGSSCSSVCSSANRTYHDATKSYAGSNGTSENCKQIASLFTTDLGHIDLNTNFIPNGSGQNLGCSVYSFFGVDIVYRYLTSTDSSASEANHRRICACTD